MLGVAFGVGVLLALAGSTAAHDCVASQELVSKMVRSLEDSVDTDELPNPSVLLALNLAGATDSGTRKWLLQEISEKAVERAQKDMSSGEVALYVLALLSSCQKPESVTALGQTVDLLQVLQQKTDEEMASLEMDGVPKTTLFGVSLDALGLCLAGAGGYETPAVALAKQLLSSESTLSVDTRAVAALALACAYGRTSLHDVRDLLGEAVAGVSNGFLDEQEERDGVIGNIYSMGLALQELEATASFYAPREWDCAQAFSVVYSHDYSQPTAIAQLLPALVGRSYLEAAGIDCTAGATARQRLSPSLSPKLDTTTASRALITVHYSIVNKLQGQHFDYSTSVRVAGGSTLLEVLEAAANEEPDIFSFQTEQTSWGPMVVSIHGLAASTEDKTYWQFLSSGDALDEGVGTYKPQDGDHIQAVFSTY
ncbi:cobalamin binding intrinsic factor [Opisthocomus hoazin]|uniref:cobalamin binding intrinsic factor n=1 Tax=Opisthocomus hoazin TaxID=30419 RepID=UPI003F5336CE